MRSRLPDVIEAGAIESTGWGRGIRYYLSRDLYAVLGKKGVYTRRCGLDRETNKALLMKHLSENRGDGTPISELSQVLPALSERFIRRLMEGLRREGFAEMRGEHRGACWHVLNLMRPAVVKLADKIWPITPQNY